MSNRVKRWLLPLVLLLPLGLTPGCGGTGGILQEANAVLLESSLISMQNNMLTYFVYKYFNIPLTSSAAGL